MLEPLASSSGIRPSTHTQGLQITTSPQIIKFTNHPLFEAERLVDLTVRRRTCAAGTYTGAGLALILLLHCQSIFPVHYCTAAAQFQITDCVPVFVR
jgi:hypothetical protein